LLEAGREKEQERREVTVEKVRLTYILLSLLNVTFRRVDMRQRRKGERLGYQSGGVRRGIPNIVR
jgi:hypothetical protein